MGSVGVKIRDTMDWPNVTMFTPVECLSMPMLFSNACTQKFSVTRRAHVMFRNPPQFSRNIGLRCPSWRYWSMSSVSYVICH